MWRGCIRSGLSVAAPFVWRCPSTRRLQPFRCLHSCSGCFRLERLPGGACTHWRSAAFSRRTPKPDIRGRLELSVPRLRYSARVPGFVIATREDVVATTISKVPMYAFILLVIIVIVDVGVAMDLPDPGNAVDERAVMDEMNSCVFPTASSPRASGILRITAPVSPHPAPLSSSARARCGSGRRIPSACCRPVRARWFPGA